MKDFIELIIDHAKNYPDRIAVIDGERKVSYAAFLSLVNNISHNLLKNGSNPKVVFDLKQGVEAYALIVAVMNIGGTYCPLNPDAPLERKMQIINEFKPDYIVVENQLNITEFKPFVPTAFSALLTGQPLPPVEINHNEDAIIYVIYTSGTTGVPKGVMISRKALAKFLVWSIPSYAAKPGDIWGQFSFLSFDLSIVDIFTCLCSGATLFAMNDIPAKKNRPAGIIEKHKITIWHSIPSAVEFMIINERTKTYDFSSLRLMSFCGEPLRKHQVEFLFKKNNGITVFNTYGPTEGTLFCTWQELNTINYLDFCEFTMSIGKAIPGWNLKLTEVPDHLEKEIIIYGDYIGKGYLGNPADSKFRLLELDGKMENTFETGDLVAEKNGNLYFIGRKDRQVKIKGFRVELDEIDYWINELLNKTSVTVVKKDSLYSFIETDDTINDGRLREFLKTKMEPYKIPNAFFAIKEIPRSQNQKIDNGSLIKLLA